MLSNPFSMPVIMGMEDPMSRKMNPIEQLQEEQLTRSQKRQKSDLDLHKKWLEGGKQPKDLAPLLKRYEPLVTSRVRQMKPPNVPEAAFKDEIRKKMIEAAHTLKPERGAVSTHFVTRVAGASRFGKQRANVGYLPERKAGAIGTINKARDELTDLLGRDPTTEELSSKVREIDPRTKMTPKTLRTIMKGMRRDVSASAFESDPLGGAAARDVEIAGPLMRASIEAEYPGKKKDKDEAIKAYDMMFTPEGQATGVRPGEMARRLGKHPSQISRIRTRIINIHKKYM
jgi:hypothetical protein